MKTKFFSLSLFLISFYIFGQLKSPSEFLGYELGTKFTRHYKVVQYFEHLAKNSNKINFTEYGTTNELRSLNIAYISSESNLQNLEKIRKQHLSNTGIENGTKLNDKSIVWLSYNVHGNEASATETSMLTAYKLITEKSSWLKNTLVILDPCLNPDGRDRYVNWFYQVANKNYNPNPDAREHFEPWVSGRPNHYLFDLNRDWAWATQIETQQRLKVYNKWMPHIHVDFHEQGINSPYYFAPAAEPFHEVITKWQRNFQDIIGKNHAKYFDKEGWLYFTKESFDLLYPSYGDTYPTFNGAIGMTYEQAGHGMAGLGIETQEGDILKLTDRIAHHHTTGLSTVEIASKNAQKINSEFKKYFDNKNFKYKSYVLQGDEDKKYQLTQLLDKHNIKYELSNATTVSGFDYQQNKKGSLKTTEKDLIISSKQPKGNLVKVLFEPKAMIKDSMTYDITAWSIPYAYGLKAIASERIIRGKPQKIAPQKATLKNNVYAYIFDWNHISDAKLLANLHRAGIRVRFTKKQIVNSGLTLAPGTLIVMKRDNKKVKNFDKKVYEIALENNKPNKAIHTGYASKGADLGSSSVKEIKNQKIAILAGKQASTLGFGEIQYFFEQNIQYPHTVINSDRFSIEKLNKYHTLILPNGFYNGLLKDKQLKALKSWIRKGGKVIAVGNACGVFADNKIFGLKSKKSTSKKDKKENTADKDSHLISFASSQREGIKNLITGAIFRTKVDNSHPLAFGYDNEYFTLKLSGKGYQYLKNGFNVVRLEDNTIISGFAGSKTLKNQEKSLVFGEERIGRGSIIYMIDNPLFRGFWDNGKLFFANALFMNNASLKKL